MYPFEIGPIRPVDEADSLLIRTTRNCPWNKCEFCVNYQHENFSIRSVEEIKNDIEKTANYYSNNRFERCFLQDGDSLIMRTADLLDILTYLKTFFPDLKTISSYGRAWSMSRKSPAELNEICEAGLNLLYCGMESGADEVLEMVNKGVSSKEIISAGIHAKEAGMRLSEFVISGLGGRELWQVHAKETAKALNAINADKIRVLTIGVKPGSGLEQKIADGSYTLQTEENIIEEQKMMVHHLNGITSHYAHHHAVDLLLEVRGQLPKDKDYLLSIFDRFLDLSDNYKRNFILGRRLGFYNRLDDLHERNNYNTVEKQFQKFGINSNFELENLYHSLRSQIV